MGDLINVSADQMKSRGPLDEPTFRDIFEYSPDGLVLTDQQGVIIDWNQGAEQITGIPRREALGQQLGELQFRLLPKEQQTRAAYREVKSNITEIINTRQSPWLYQPHHHEICSQDGTKRIIQYLVFAVETEHGVRFGSILRDITATKRMEAALLGSERRYQQLVEHAPTGIYEVDLRTGKFNDVNDLMCEYTGYSKEEILAINPLDLLTADSRKEFLHWHNQAIAGRPAHADMEYKVKRKDGSEFWVLTNSNLEYEHGRLVRVIVIAHEISKRKQMEQSLKEALAWQQAIFEGSNDAIFICDTATRFIAVNKAACALTGYSKSELLEMCIPDLHEGEDLIAHQLFHSRIMTGEEITNETRILRKDGTKLDAEFSNRLLAIGGKNYLHTAVRDVTKRKEVEARLRALATRDFLTQLPNRLSFQDHLEHALYRAKRQKQSLALLYLDLDGFKTINDSFGHTNGDKVLRNVSKRMAGCFRESDLLARLGGDEFAIILEDDLPLEDVKRVAQKVVDCFSQPFKFDGNQAQLSASIGISIFPTDSETSQTLLQQADKAMYRAKQTGKNQFCFFGDYLHE